ncbi:hypothetical protein PoB_006654700 [Plakobranchus ocellatus]|uniref:Uncharacterized protein n=1 Tax=Plakobranchus ocellatus TaxID=259542 RepID=A0AAV4D7H7_9GAST|nr:hypothetical protein PoB_006654700 [Plakobranchus ocellatus]
MDSESALRSAGTVLLRIPTLPSAPWPVKGPEKLRSPCCGLAIYKNQISCHPHHTKRSTPHSFAFSLIRRRLSHTDLLYSRHTAPSPRNFSQSDRYRNHWGKPNMQSIVIQRCT